MIALNPYLHFNGNAEEALQFYHSILGGDLRISRYGDFPNPSVTKDLENQVMHGVVESGNVYLMASDTGPMGEAKPGSNMSISLSGDDDALLTKYFAGLSQGGNVTQPLEKQQWGDKFGMVTDRFGVTWFVNITAPMKP